MAILCAARSSDYKKTRSFRFTVDLLYSLYGKSTTNPQQIEIVKLQLIGP